MMAWSSLAQFLSLVLAAPLDFVPGFGNSASITQFVESMKNATLCVANDLASDSSNAGGKICFSPTFV